MATRKKADSNGSEFRFVKLYEDWCDHPKAIAAGDAACGAWSRILAYTSRTMRAHVPHVKAFAFAFDKQSNLDRLIEVGLLESDGAGYRMHDWEIWQAELHAIVESKRRLLERAAKGGKAKAERAAQAGAKQTQAELSSAKQNRKASQEAAIAGENGDSEIRQTETKTERKTEIETDLSGSANDCSRKGSEEIQNAPAPLDAAQRIAVSDYGDFDPKRSWAVTVEVWKKAGPYKGEGGEGDLSSAHRKFDEKISGKNWAAFARVLDWSVGRAIETRNRQMLGVLYRFIDVNWEKKEPFAATELPPLAKPAAEAALTTEAAEALRIANAEAAEAILGAKW